MIRDIRLQHFRSYQDSSFEFALGVNIIVGQNAAGKTNLLEAVLVICRGGSYRVKDADLVRFGAPWARIDTHTETHERILKLQEQPNGWRKAFTIDDQNVVRLTAAKMEPIVLFEPNHLLLLSSSPDLRRTFLDDLIEQTESGFGALRRHYRRVLTQRNALLKKSPRDLAEQLFVWNLRLSELGGKIARERAKLVEQFNESATDLYAELAANANTIDLQYASRFSIEHYETALLRKLEESTELDRLRGFTAYGPHRDDLSVLIDGRPLQETASRGETRTLVLALKIMELQLLEKARGQKPILLLDDVFSELDAKRRQALTRFVQSYQTFITTTDADVVAGYFSDDHKIISL